MRARHRPGREDRKGTRDSLALRRGAGVGAKCSIRATCPIRRIAVDLRGRAIGTLAFAVFLAAMQAITFAAAPVHRPRAGARLLARLRARHAGVGSPGPSAAPEDVAADVALFGPEALDGTALAWLDEVPVQVPRRHRAAPKARGVLSHRACRPASDGCGWIGACMTPTHARPPA